METPLVTALAGMTIGCSDPHRFVSFLVDVWDWEVLVEGAIDPDLEQIWAIEKGSAGSTFSVVRSRGADRGMVRVIAGPERPRPRQRAARWAGFEVVVMRDIAEIHDAMVAHPDVTPFGLVKSFDFVAAGSNIHRAFSSRLPGGTHVTMTMAVTQPEGRDFPTANAQVGHIFEVPVNSPNYARCRAFYGETLGMIPVLESSSNDGPMHKAWGVPPGPLYHLDILKGDAPGAGLGSVEIHGCDADFIDPEPATPGRFDGGACMASLTTSDIMTVFAAVEKSPDATILSEPRAVSAAAYAGARVFCFSGPDDERVEICESMWA